MGEPEHLHDVLIILVAAVLIGTALRRMHASAVLGYLVAGALIGPHGFDLVADVPATRVLAEFGVVFLLFAIGLELSVERLIALRHQVFGLGTLQVLLSGALIWGVLRLFGVPSAAALVLGGGLALSSTAVVLQMLAERGQLTAPYGRVAFSVLLLQDLAVVPLLTLVPLLGGGEAGVLSALGGALLRAVVVLVAMLALGRLALRPLLRAVARGRSNELFTGIVLLLVLGMGWITQLAGLSMAMGAFLAGLLVSETEFRPQVEGDVAPFRGILLALFFMTVGMEIDVALVWRHLPLVIGSVVALLVLKTLVLAVLCRLFGFGGGLSVRIGTTLAQGGEFAFVLFALATGAGVLPSDMGRIAILLVALSMATTPLLLDAGERAERWLEARAGGTRIPVPPAAEVPRLSRHVLIAGFGRVGRTMARLLEARGVRYVALDRDTELVATAHGEGLPVYFGEASQAEVLRAAGAERARVAVITLDEPEPAARAVRALRRMRPDLPILVRAHDVDECGRLLAAGATQVIPEIVEGSLQLGENLLLELGGEHGEVVRLLDDFRRRAYARLSDLARRAPA